MNKKYSLRTQVIILLSGLYPLGMLLLFLMRGNGMHRWLMGFTLVYGLGFIMSLNYHFYYRQSPPKVVIHPSGFWKALIACLFVLPFALINLWGVEKGWSLTLSPNGTQEILRWPQLAAKMLLGSPVDLPVQVMANIPPWAYHPWFLKGAMWGGIGYAITFGVGSAVASLLRKEVFDPRQTPFGGGLWFIFKPLIALFYGGTLGFYLGATIIYVGQALFGKPGIPSTLSAMLYAFGCVLDPNRAMTMGFSAGGILYAMTTLFMGKGDFTAAFSDPKRPEKDPPMKVHVPELPKVEPLPMDYSAITAETEQLTAQFNAELRNLITQMGLDEIRPEQAEEIPEDAPKEPPTRNVISARMPDFDTSFDGAMGQLSNVYVQISAQIGSVDFPLADWTTIEEGSMIELPRASDNSVVLCINNRPVGRAKPVMVNNHLGVKVLALNDDAIENLKEERR